MNTTRSTPARPRPERTVVRAAVLAVVLLLAPAFVPAAAAADYGPDTCLNGFVWRDAVPGDHVCVTPATRSRAAGETAAAAARRNAPRLRYTTYTERPRCEGDVCTSTSIDDIPSYRLHGDRVNPGPVSVELRRITGDVLVKRWRVTATPAGVPGGRFTVDTDVVACSGARNSYFRLQDGSSGRWSPAYQVSTGCKVL